MGLTVTGTITTQNLNPTTGTATAGSFIKISDKGSATYRAPIDSVSVQVTGTYTGALTPQVSNDGETWVAVGPVMVYNVGTGEYSQTIASASVGLFNVRVGGIKYFRVSANAAITGTATITLNGSEATGVAGLGALPMGATNQVQGLTAAMTATADTPVIAAPGAGISTYVTGVHVVNTHATVGTEVHIKDGTTIIDRFFVPALSERNREYPTPLKLTANAVLNAATVTTGSNTYVQAVGFKAL